MISLFLFVIAGMTSVLPTGTDWDVEPYRRLLSRYVQDGRVNYKAFTEQDRAELNAFVTRLGSAALPEDRHLRLGFYVDAYNALVIQSVLDHKRPRSVLDVKGFFKQKKHRVLQKQVSLDQLEKEIILPFARDPRVHFVLVCAAVGCPKLESTPYWGTNVDQRMEDASRHYIQSPWGATISPGQLQLSRIFDWYKDDFGGSERVLVFVQAYLSEEQKRCLGPEPKLGFIDYNWTLNQQ